MVDSVDKTITRMEASAEIAAGLADVIPGAEGSSTGKTIKIHMGNYQAAVVGSGNLGGNDPDHLSKWAENSIQLHHQCCRESGNRSGDNPKGSDEQKSQ